jgi:hypothetical protein
MKHGGGAPSNQPGESVGGIRSFAGEGYSAKIYRASNQTLTDGVTEKINFSRLVADGGGFWFEDEPTRLYIPVAGFYSLFAVAAFDQDPTGRRTLEIWRNGNISGDIISKASIQGFAGFDNVLNCIGGDYFEQDQYVEVYATQTSGGGLPIVSSGTYSPSLMIIRSVN